MDYARSLLEELMTPYEETSKKNYYDDEVCKDFLVKFCPNDLFVNTKADLGPCEKIHDERLRTEYQEDKENTRYRYEERFISNLRSLIDEVERKILRAKDKVEGNLPVETNYSKRAEAEEKIVIIEEKISSLSSLVETAGEEGRINEAKSYTTQIESLQSELDRLRKTMDPNAEDPTLKPMEVCLICGAFLIAGGEVKRLEAHVAGKMHTGYQMIRDALQEHKDKEKLRSETRERVGTPDSGSRSSSKYSRNGDDYYRRDYNDLDRPRSRDYSGDKERRYSRDRSPHHRPSPRSHGRYRSPDRYYDRRRY